MAEIIAGINFLWILSMPENHSQTEQSLTSFVSDLPQFIH